eukprot:428891-Pleurochrysis_carterae.AAC.1
MQAGRKRRHIGDGSPDESATDSYQTLIAIMREQIEGLEQNKARAERARNSAIVERNRAQGLESNVRLELSRAEGQLSALQGANREREQLRENIQKKQENERRYIDQISNLELQVRKSTAAQTALDEYIRTKAREILNLKAYIETLERLFEKRRRAKRRGAKTIKRRRDRDPIVRKRAQSLTHRLRDSTALVKVKNEQLKRQGVDQRVLQQTLNVANSEAANKLQRMLVEQRVLEQNLGEANQLQRVLAQQANNLKRIDVEK